MSEATITTLEQAPTGTVVPVIEEAKPENVATIPTPPEPKKELLSDKYATFARKERTIVKARQELSAQKADFERERNAFKERIEKLERLEKIRENAKLDPDSYLNEAGLSYGSLTERNLKGGVDPNAILEKANQTIEQFKKDQESAKKAAEEANKTQAQKDYEVRVQNFVQGIYDFVGQNKETYELTELNGQQNLVWEVIQEASKRGTEMSVKQAADKVEEYLTQQIEKSIATAKKFKDKFTAPKPVEPPKPGSPTLSNKMTTSTQPTRKHLSEAERERNALLAMNKVLGEQ